MGAGMNFEIGVYATIHVHFLSEETQKKIFPYIKMYVKLRDGVLKAEFDVTLSKFEFSLSFGVGTGALTHGDGNHAWNIKPAFDHLKFETKLETQGTIADEIK